MGVVPKSLSVFSLAKLSAFLRGCCRSCLAWLFVTVHGAWFFLAIANMSSPSPSLGDWIDRGAYVSTSLLAGRPFHYTHESMALKVLFLVDLPSFLASILVSLLVLPLRTIVHFGSYRSSYIAAAILLVLGSVQWLVLGNVLEFRIRLNESFNNSFKKLNHLIVAAIVLVLLATAIVTPMVNARSRRLGFRHAGISSH
jgi:hypothetical protein